MGGGSPLFRGIPSRPELATSAAASLGFRPARGTIEVTPLLLPSDAILFTDGARKLRNYPMNHASYPNKALLG